MLSFFPCFTQENLDVTSLRPENLFVLNLLAPLWVSLNENFMEIRNSHNILYIT